MPVSNAKFDTPNRLSPKNTRGYLPYSGDGEYILADGWRMIEGEKMISEPVLSAKCNMSEWYNATVPGTVLTTLVDQGVYPDPYIGLNNLSIPDTLCRMDWWYRIEFDSPQKHQFAKLIFNGINYRAQVWLNGVFLGSIAGAFKRGIFEVGPILKKKRNILAVRILPPNNPGIPQEQNMKDFGNNGGAMCMDGPTFFATEGWDWIPGIRDRSIGIWQDVRLRFESSISIESVNVKSDLPLPDTTSAELSVFVKLKNNTETTQEFHLTAVSDVFDVSEFYTINPKETRTIVLSSEKYPQLLVKNPVLWWPNGYGEPNLHSATVTIEDGAGSISSKSIRYGIRELSYELMAISPENETVRIHYSPTDLSEGEQERLFSNEEPFRYLYTQYPDPHMTLPRLNFWPENGFIDVDKDSGNPHFSLRVNGVRIFCKGGNMGMDDAMKRVSRERLEPYIRLHKEANMNLLRNWNGQSTEEVLYDLCDEYGILVWNDFFVSTEWWNLRPLDSNLFLSNTADVIERFSYHASIALWCSGNETYLQDPLEKGIKTQIGTLDGTRHYQGNSRYHNMRPSGPWCYSRDFNYYFNSLAEGFNTELGATSVPTYETLKKFIKQEDLWPMNDTWAYHDALFSGWVGWNEYCEDIDAFGFAPCANAEEFCNRAQVFNYNMHRMMFESWNSKIWHNASGVIYWMSHPAWYSLVQQSYSADYKTFGTFFGQKISGEPIHIQWEPSGLVRIVNASRKELDCVFVYCKGFTIDGKEIYSSEYVSSLKPNSDYEICKINVSEWREDVSLLRLVVEDAHGNILSRNDYWCSADGYSYAPEGLIGCPVSTLCMKSSHEGGKWIAEVTNTGNYVVPYIEMNIVDSSGASILPQYFSDSYFNLLPGETRKVCVDVAEYMGDAKMTARGLNAKIIEDE